MQDIEKFIAGFRRFQQKYFASSEPLFRKLKEGQAPTTLLIGCSDSRVDPALLTDCNPGEIFIVRNVANIVPPCEPDNQHHGVSAAIQFAVCHLEVKQIIVLGHAHCGGIHKLLHQAQPPKDPYDFLGRWIDILQPAKQQVETALPHHSHDEKQHACELAGILLSLENLLTFPWVKERVDRGVLSLHGWYFDLEHGELKTYDPQNGQFLPLVAAPTPTHPPSDA